MKNWQRFLDSLNTGGGHILWLSVAVILGGVMACSGVHEGRDLMVGAGAALLAMLRPQGSGQ